jgi:hypothetical protein
LHPTGGFTAESLAINRILRTIFHPQNQHRTDSHGLKVAFGASFRNVAAISSGWLRAVIVASTSQNDSGRDESRPEPSFHVIPAYRKITFTHLIPGQSAKTALKKIVQIRIWSARRALQIFSSLSRETLRLANLLRCHSPLNLASFLKGPSYVIAIDLGDG